MERYTLEVSGRGACAYDFGLLDGNGAGHAFGAAVPASTKESIRRVADPRPDAVLLAGRAGRTRRKAYRRHNEELFRTAGALVHARQHTCPAGQPIDLLSRLVSTPDPETGALLDAETVRDQVLMHLSNGFNGPSITAAWLVAVLATRPDVEAELIAEIDGITGGDPGYDLRYDDLASLTYTTQVIKEALRVYPPMPITIRRSLKDGLLGRYRVRTGTSSSSGRSRRTGTCGTGARIPTGSTRTTSRRSGSPNGPSTPSSRSRSDGGSAWRRRSRS